MVATKVRGLQTQAAPFEVKRSDWPVWTVADGVVQSPFKFFFLSSLPSIMFSVGFFSRWPCELKWICDNCIWPVRAGWSSVPVVLLVLLVGPAITPLYLQSHACSPCFDLTLRFCPFRVPGEEPRQPPHGHHPARPLLQEQVHQADLPGGRGHGESKRDARLMVGFVCVGLMFSPPALHADVTFLGFVGSLPFSLYLPAGVGSH